jgi:hypothetical protein
MRPIPCTTLAVILLVALAALPGAAAERQMLRHRFHGTALPAVSRVPATNVLHAALCLPLRNQAELTNLLARLYNPTNPDYRHYLTPAEFTERFGPTRDDYAAVLAYAQAHGLQVTASHPNRTLVDLTGTTAAFEQAFATRLQRYHHPRENRLFHAPEVAPSLALAVPVLSIAGLDNYAVPRPAGLRPAPAATPLAGSGPHGYFRGYDFRKAYAPDVTLTGAGQIVGLVQFDGYYASDIAAYVRQAGLPNVPLENILLNDFDGHPGDNNAEVAMDIELVISMAPGLARILVYETSPYDTAISVLNRMATDNRAKQLSASWTWWVLDPGTEQVFKQFAAQGQSYFNASGDDNAYTGFITAPCDNPYITIVGGTTLTTDTRGNWSSEVVWNWGTNGGSGGGSSPYYVIPAWQQGLSMTANHGSTTMRNIPDVAMAADNVWVIYDKGTSAAFGGTSAAAPLWAGFTALINEQAVTNGHPTVGFLNPALYALGTNAGYSAAFHDIVSGANTNEASPTRYHAVPGYDLCTGWGTPAGQALIDALAGAPAALAVTPATGFTANGPTGGPFAPASATYLLTNRTTYALAWSCTTTSSWLALSATHGTLPPGAATNVTVALLPAVSNLPAGEYTGTVSFVNNATDATTTLTFLLRIGQSLVKNGSFESGSFSDWSLTSHAAGLTISTAASYARAGTYGAKLGPSTTLAYLSQSLITVPGQYYRLAFWLNSPNGRTPNVFQACWNNTTPYAKTNLPTLGWTNVQLLVVATGTTTTLKFAFRDASYLGLDEISVTPLPAASIATLTVQTAHGSAAPGTTVVTTGSPVTQRIVNTPVVVGTTQYVCTGAAVDGNSFTQDTATTVTLTLTNQATLTWRWQTNYWLGITTNGKGSIAPGGWQQAGTTVVLKATPHSSSRFIGWSGQTNGCLISSNVLVAPMAAPRAITATFAAGAIPILSGTLRQAGTGTRLTNITLTASSYANASNSLGTTTTDSNGTYTLAVPYGWSGTLTPSAATGAFSPASKTYSRLTSRKTANFLWYPPPVISGSITQSGSREPASGLTITFIGEGRTTNTTTDSHGLYAVSVPYHWSGTATPATSAGDHFAPVAKGYKHVTHNLPRQNYTWTAPATLQPAPQARPAATAAAPGLPPPPLLHTYGLAIWSGSAAQQIRLAPELLWLQAAAGTTEVVLPAGVAVPDDLSATVTIQPALQQTLQPETTPLLRLRQSQGRVSADTPLPAAYTLGEVTFLPVGNTMVLRWDLFVTE